MSTLLFACYPSMPDYASTRRVGLVLGLGTPTCSLISLDSGPCHGILLSSHHPHACHASFPQTSPRPPDHPPPGPPHS